MERVRLALRISKNILQAHRASKCFKLKICEAGLRGVGLNFRPFASKAVS